jgi:molybdopterin molybdotransferase
MALIPVEEALTRVLDGAQPLPAERVATADAHGRVLTEDLAARRTHPPADVSAMDGYAVRSTDVTACPARLKLVGEAAAGRVFGGAVGQGEAARILTGGLLPAGADTIVIQENTKRDGDIVIVETPSRPGRHVRRAGLDFREGDVLLRAGRRLSVRDLAVASAMNHPTVAVHRRPRIAVLSTGDELMPPGSSLAPGQIVSSNGPALAAMARAEGAEALDLGIAPDRMEETIASIRGARDWGADVLLTTGGASVGDHDLVQAALVVEGLDLAFWKVALRPGKPLMHGKLGSTRVLGLPGNPVSAFVCAFLFMVPLVRRLGGRADIEPAIVRARLGRDLPENDERQDYLRSTLRREADGTLVATPLDVQDSSMMTGLAKADCLVVRAPFAAAARAGDECTSLALGL